MLIMKKSGWKIHLISSAFVAQVGIALPQGQEAGTKVARTLTLALTTWKENGKI